MSVSDKRKREEATDLGLPLTATYLTRFLRGLYYTVCGGSSYKNGIRC